MSKSQQAVKWLSENPGKSQVEAGKLFGLTQSVISKAVKASKRPRCETCGRLTIKGAK
jgi:predicted transcriptional regulator